MYLQKHFVLAIPVEVLVSIEVEAIDKGYDKYLAIMKSSNSRSELLFDDTITEMNQNFETVQPSNLHLLNYS